MMKRYACIGLLTVAIAAVTGVRKPVMGATYYVAPKGNDANPGAEARPWATLRKAAGSVQPGDTVRIKAGDYFEPSGWNVTRAGTAQKPITYQAYGDGEVRISPSSVVPAGAWTHVKEGIYSAQVSQRPAYVFQNAYPLHPPGDRGKIYSVDEMIPNAFYVSGTTLYVWLEDGSDPSKSAIRAASAHGVELRDCHYTIFDGLTVEYGFNGFKDQGKATHHVTYRNCTIRSIGSQGIQPVPQDSVIERNLFQKIGSNKYLHGIYNRKPGLIVRYNVFEEIAGAAIHQYNQDSPAGGSCEFYGNIFRKPRKMTMRSPASRSPAVRRPPGRDTLRRLRDYYVEIIAWGEGNNRIYNNVFYGEGKRGGISLNSFNNRVYHNTFTGSAYGIEFHTGKTGNQVVNNIVKDAATSFLIWPAKALPQTLDYNIYHNAVGPPRWQRDGVTYQAFSAYQQAAGETHSRYQNPGLVGAKDARLRPGSPAIDAGAALDGVAVDAEGVARPQGGARDIGAYEARPASTPSEGGTVRSVPVRAYSSERLTASLQTGGPLRVHPGNPRYFTDGTKNADGSLKAVYLTGSHTWHNLQDGGPVDPPPAFNYRGFLDFLVEQNHNFFRLWAWESPREAAWHKGTLYCRPLPFLGNRVEGVSPSNRGQHREASLPGDARDTALDGKPKYDLTQFDPEYFERLRDRVKAAQERGLYVGVMLFQGFSVAKKSSRAQGNPWPGHPFHRDNNINGIDGDLNGDGNGYEVHTLDNARITALQEAYVRKVIDTVGQFDNVIYEISNESHGGSTAWQYHIIRFIKEVERGRAQRHPVWMSFQWDQTDGPGTNAMLWASEAEAVSPRHGSDAREAYRTDPPAADGSKVVLLDTDHLWGEGGDAAWVWKSFLRGYQPIYMDRIAELTADKRGDIPGADGVRRAMGITRRLAERVNLAAMTPRPELASIAYCLTDPGKEYIVYLPEGGEVTVDLSAVSGTIAVRWLHPVEETVISGEPVKGQAERTVKSPFSGDAVLHLTTQTHHKLAIFHFPFTIGNRKLRNGDYYYEDQRCVCACRVGICLRGAVSGGSGPL